MGKMSELCHCQSDREEPPKKRKIVRLNPNYVSNDIRLIDSLYTNIRTHITYVSNKEATED